MSGRHPKRDPGGLDLVLRAHEPLGHGRLGHEEHAGDLLALSPPSVRNVSATWASSASAGWQQVKMSSSRSSGIVVSSMASSVASGRSSRRVLSASMRSRRMRSIARLRAVVMSQARGLTGVPSRGQRLRGDRKRLLGGLLGEVEVAEEADQVGQDAAPLVAEGLVEDR